jgi:hypothetical protein
MEKNLTAFLRDNIAVTRITHKQCTQSDFKDGPRLADGVNGPGWYWHFKHDTHPDTWWFGPFCTEEWAWWECQESRWWEQF